MLRALHRPRTAALQLRRRWCVARGCGCRRRVGAALQHVAVVCQAHVRALIGGKRKERGVAVRAALFYSPRRGAPLGFCPCGAAPGACPRPLRCRTPYSNTSSVQGMTPGRSKAKENALALRPAAPNASGVTRQRMACSHPPVSLVQALLVPFVIRKGVALGAPGACVRKAHARALRGRKHILRATDASALCPPTQARRKRGAPAAARRGRVATPRGRTARAARRCARRGRRTQLRCTVHPRKLCERGAPARGVLCSRAAAPPCDCAQQRAAQQRRAHSWGARAGNAR